MKRTGNSEERDILRSYDRGEWRSVKDLHGEAKRLRGYARRTMLKDKRINIRMSSKDLSDLQARAMEEGIPYQTLISSVLHKYISGRFEERK